MLLPKRSNHSHSLKCKQQALIIKITHSCNHPWFPYDHMVGIQTGFEGKPDLGAAKLIHIEDIIRRCIEKTAQHTRVRRRRREKKSLMPSQTPWSQLQSQESRTQTQRENFSPCCWAFVHLVSLTQPQGCCNSKASSLLEEADLTANGSEVSTTNGTQVRPWLLKFCSQLRIWHWNVKMSCLEGNYISRNK